MENKSKENKLQQQLAKEMAMKKSSMLETGNAIEYNVKLCKFWTFKCDSTLKNKIYKQSFPN